jgi:hypothetical protein
VDDAPDFHGLRRRGIALAQEFSGEAWTDYNLHDPGVTLLEQFCFALTEYAYRADFPVADLLTAPDGHLDLRRLRLDLPREVLPSRPVTARDLALMLSEGHVAVERVLVYPGAGAAAGLYDVFVVPAPDADAAEALDAVRRAFHASRNLCEDMREVALAVPVRCRLDARIEMPRRHSPERVAAVVYDRCRRLMRDRAATRSPVAATRRDVFEEPARIFGHLADAEGGAASIDAFFAGLTGVDEVEDVMALAFGSADGSGRDPFAPLGRGEYRELVLPQRPEQVGLRLASHDLEIPFDLAGMHAELARLRADHVARLADSLDPLDWAEPRPGRQRSFDHVPLGHGLPAAYGAGRDRMPRSASLQARVEAGRLRGYLALGDGLLANANADLAGLAELYAGDNSDRASYRVRPLEFGPMPELDAGAPGALAATVASLDPWHDRKGRFLEYLLALHGEEFSLNSLRHHDLYRSPTGRRDAVPEARARLLTEIATLNRDRAGAPDITAGERAAAIGLARKLVLLLDFPDQGTAPLSAAIRRAGLAVAEGLGPDGDWRLPRAGLAVPDDPFATLVPRIEAPPRVDRSELVAGTPFLRGRAIGGDVLRGGVRAESWLLAPEPGGCWRVVFDPGAGAVVLDAGLFAERAGAVVRANQLRVFLTDLNRRSEGVHLVEDVLLRGVGPFTPLSFTVVLPGWSARTATASFRWLAEETVRLLAPVHLAHRVVWLDHGQMEAFEALELQWRVAFRDACGGGVRAGELDRAGGALRAFLAESP